MTINFDALPKDRPEGTGFKLPDEGFHKATITKPVVKTSAAGNDYLELQLKLATGGIVFDRIMNSDKPALQYKIARFITACKLPLVGELTLADLGKVVENKEIVVDVEHRESEYKGKVTTRAEVALFKNDIYYPIEQYASLIGGAEPQPDVETTTTPGTY